MDIIKNFGDKVGSEALTDPEKARRLLLTGYRLQEKRLRFFPDKELPSSGQYVARVVMRNIIQALAKPENAAMVSAGRTIDGSRIDTVFSRSVVMFYSRNQM